RLNNEAAAWTTRAEALAAWTARRLVNRTDAWGGYGDDSQLTCRGTLTRSRLVRHFQARSRAGVLGLHSASADNLALWGAVAVDHHGEQRTPAEINLAAALAWDDHLRRLGFRPLLTTSNGRGGFHLRILLAEATPADRLFHFLRALVSNHQQLALPAPPEHFP